MTVFGGKQLDTNEEDCTCPAADLVTLEPVDALRMPNQRSCTSLPLSTRPGPVASHINHI